ncbi:MAG TPA: hypothetical protein ENL08_04950 [Bacteroidetes bacterium]|nr:hypothetical protein [Bacteroidota bacterium]
MKNRFVNILAGGICLFVFAGCTGQSRFHGNTTVIKHSGDTSYFDDVREVLESGSRIGPRYDPIFVYVVGTDTSKYAKIARQAAWEDTRLQAMKAFETYEDSLNRSILSEILTEEDMGIWDKIFRDIVNDHWREIIFSMIDTCLTEVGWEIVWDRQGVYRSNILGRFPKRNISVDWVSKMNDILDKPEISAARREKVRSTITYREESRLVSEYLGR